MWIVQVALRRPYTFLVMALLILLATPLVLLKMSTDIFPDVDIPVISIVWNYTGLSAQEMGLRITAVNERSLTTTVNDIEHIESQSLSGISVIKVFFQPNANIPTAIAQVVAIEQTQLRQMPPGTLPPLVIKYTASAIPVIQLGLSSATMSEQAVFDTAVNFLRPRLVTIPGVAIPWPFGGKQRVISVDLDTAALLAKGLTPNDVISAVNTQNLILPSGTAKIGGIEYVLGTNASPDTLEGLNRIPVVTRNGATTYIAEVAHVRDGFSPQTNIVRQNGERGVLVSIIKNGGTSTLDIVSTLLAQLPILKQSLPPDLKITPLFDQSSFVRAAISGVVREALIAAALTAALILLFLGNWRSTCIIAVSIPLSILSLDHRPLGHWRDAQHHDPGRSRARRRHLGRRRDGDHREHRAPHASWARICTRRFWRAPAKSLFRRWSPPCAFASCSCRCSFCRVWPATLFAPLAEAVVFAMLASYVLSRTLVPTLVMLMMDLAPARTGGPAQPVDRGCIAPSTRASRRFAADTASFWQRCSTGADCSRACFMGFCLLSIGLVFVLGRDFFPTVDGGQIRLHMRLPTGTRIEETARVADQVEAAVRAIVPARDLGTVLDNLGLPISGINLSYSNSGTIGSLDGEIQVSLNKGHRPTEHYVEQMRRDLPRLFPGVEFFFHPADMMTQILNFGLPAAIDVQITGNDLRGNFSLAAKLMKQIRKVRGAVDTHIHQRLDLPTMSLIMDRTQLQQLGLSANDLAQDLLVSTAGTSQTSPAFWLNPTNGVVYTLVVQSPQYDDRQLRRAAAYAGLSGHGGRRTPQRPAAARQSRHRCAPRRRSRWPPATTWLPATDIYVSVQGRDTGGVAGEIRELVDQMRPQLPRGAQIAMLGQVQTMGSSFVQLGVGLALAVVMVYLLIVVNFQSWMDAFIIISALPAAMAGICWMLLLTATHLSVPALTGAIMTMGVATANSILIVSFARQRINDGLDPIEAALDAGTTRIRPVLMTALAMIIGMIPMALGLGEGAEQNAPLGRAVIGGLLFATVSSLFLVPVVFAGVHRRLERRKQLRSSAPGISEGNP